MRERDHVLAAAAALVEVLLLAFVPIAGVAVAVVAVVAALVRWPGSVIALSWNGFWLYLGALDLLDVAPRTRTTAAAYAAVAVALAVFIVTRRDTLVQRLRDASTALRAWVGAATLLTVWFAANVAFVSQGSLSHRLLGVLVVSTIPTVVAVASARTRDLDQARMALVVLGIAFVLIEFAAARGGAGGEARFSPIAELDPISASLIPTIATLAVATLRPRTARETILQLAALLLLTAGAALNGARGPQLALVLALVVVALVSLRLRGVLVVLVACVGLFVGSVSAQALLDTQPALSSLATEVGTEVGTGDRARSSTDPAPISSLSIRRYWLEKAVRAVPDKPLLGHGIAMLRDDSPEAERMGVSGQLVYPHNDFVESVYSLGLPGLVLFGTFVLIPVVVLWRRRAALQSPRAAFVLALFAFAVLESNFSGEIGTDVLLWSGGVLALLLYEVRAATRQ